MKTMHRLIMICVLVIVVAGCIPMPVKQMSSPVSSLVGMTDGLVFKAVKEILLHGIDQAGTTLSAPGAYTDNPAVHIALPPELQDIERKLKTLGLDRKLGELETGINRAAEQAAAEALVLFREIVNSMEVNDAKAIIRGGATAATDYLKARAHDRLLAAYTAAVTRALEESRALNTLQDIMGKYNSIPLVKKKHIAIEAHVAGKALNALFAEIAKAEAEVRANPGMLSSDSVSTVFEMLL